MKPGKYNRSTTIDAFIKQFETCSRHSKWSSEEKCDFLQCALEGSATQILWNLNTMGDLSYENLEDHLKQRFGYQEQAETYRTQLNRYRQKPTESFNDLLF